MNKTTRLKKPQIPELDTLYTFDELGGRPKYGGKEMTSETDIPSFEEIQDHVHSAIIAEATVRNDADQDLQSQVDTLDAALAAETAAREASEDDLSDALDDETAAREAADQALASDITATQGNLNAETNARTLADIDLQSQIDVIVASSDVKDIVGTKAELDEYDTSTLGDNDIIKVLADETQGGATAYYRWKKSVSKFEEIGTEGPYYTKSETDAIAAQKQDVLTAGNGITIKNNNVAVDTDVIATKEDMDTAKADIHNLEADVEHLENSKQDNLSAGNDISIENSVVSNTARGLAKVLTSADYNYPEDDPQYVALWRLPAGIYDVGELTSSEWRVDAENRAQYKPYPFGLIIVTNDNSQSSPASDHIIIGLYNTYATASALGADGIAWDVRQRTGRLDHETGFGRWPLDSLTSSATNRPLSAAQGKALKDMIGDLANLTTDEKANLVAAVNELVETIDDVKTTVEGEMPTRTSELTNDGADGDSTYVEQKQVVQSTGTSTTNVMSQNAASGMVFANPTSKTQIQIGANAWGQSNAAVSVGSAARAGSAGSAINCTAVGSSATANTANGGTAIGAFSKANHFGSIALGSHSGDNITTVGMMDVGTRETSNGYNSSNYRLLTGLYDPQANHDAATKGYVDNITAEATNSLEVDSADWSDLWQ